MAVEATTPIELVEGVYATLDARIGAARERVGRALTLAEKVLINPKKLPFFKSGKELRERVDLGH